MVDDPSEACLELAHELLDVKLPGFLLDLLPEGHEDFNDRISVRMPYLTPKEGHLVGKAGKAGPIELTWHDSERAATKTAKASPGSTRAKRALEQNPKQTGPGSKLPKDVFALIGPMAALESSRRTLNLKEVASPCKASSKRLKLSLPTESMHLLR